jgi:DNA polymerase I-like protein with 3'-5' exonuclease and polymerase domains
MQGEDGRTWVKTQWVYRHSERNKLLYGAKTLENIIQALAFIQIMEAGRRIKHRSLNEWGYALMPAHQVHDELIYVVPDELDEITLKLACEEISRKPWWMPEAPLAAEGGIGQSYGEAKEE